MTDKAGSMLDYLRENREGFVSGEELARMAGVSRAAVWKQVEKLRRRGYRIEAERNRGYRLAGVPDLLLPGEIGRGSGGRVFGREIIHYHETGSTSDRAREFADRGHPEGTVVVAERQTRGRGRMDRAWFSGDRNAVLISLVLRPEIPPDEAPCLTLLAAVAVSRAVRELSGLEPGIKWPNDLLANGKKFCGILTEMSAAMDRVNYVITGIGINVNLRERELPRELRDTATSLLIETGKKVSRAELARSLLREFENLYGIFTSRGAGPILSEWKKLSGVIGKRGRVELFSGTIEGEIIDIDGRGRLVIRDREGERHAIVNGDILLYE